MRLRWRRALQPLYRTGNDSGRTAHGKRSPGRLFTGTIDLEKKSALLEAETQTLDRWVTDLQSIQHLIKRCIDINKNAVKDGLQLVAAGTLFDIQTALTVTESELHPIEVQCRNAVIYPEIDGRQPQSGARSFSMRYCMRTKSRCCSRGSASSNNYRRATP
jgi:hypothetical protein